MATNITLQRVKVSDRSKMSEPETDSNFWVFLNWLIFFCLLPFGVMVFIPLRIWKSLVICYAKLFIPNIGSALTGYDSIFAIDNYYEKPYAGNVTLFVVEGNLTINDLRNGFIQNVLSVEKNDNGSNKTKPQPQFERLYSVPTVIGGYYFWKRLAVDIEAQIRVAYKFTAGGNDATHDDELNRVIGQLMTSPFPKGCPLWELLLYSGFKTDQSVVVFRLHHTLGDGYTFNHLVDQMIQKKSPYMVKNIEKSFGKKGELLLTVAPKLYKLYAEGFTHKDYYTQSKQNTTGVVSMTSIDLNTMKSIRRATNTHFATVGMSVLCGALRRYFLENKPLSELPPYVSIMHSLPKPNHPLNQMVNHWGVGIFKIPMEIENPLDRLKESELNFECYMDDQYNEIIQCHVPLFNLLPESVIRQFFKTNFGTGLGFTSVPAYEKEASLFGKSKIVKMHKIFGFQWAQTAVAAAVYTQNGKVSFAIFANKDIVADQAGIDRVTKEYLHLEIEELVKQCGLEIESPISPTPDTIITNNNNTISLTKTIHRYIRTEGFA